MLLVYTQLPAAVPFDSRISFFRWDFRHSTCEENITKTESEFRIGTPLLSAETPTDPIDYFRPHVAWICTTRVEGVHVHM